MNRPQPIGSSDDIALMNQCLLFSDRNHIVTVVIAAAKRTTGRQEIFLSFDVNCIARHSQYFSDESVLSAKHDVFPFVIGTPQTVHYHTVTFPHFGMKVGGSNLIDSECPGTYSQHHE